MVAMAASSRATDSASRWAADLVIAAAIIGSAELFIRRALNPLVAYVPPLGSAVGARAASLLDASGEGAASATVLLVFAATASWIAARASRDRVAGGALALAVVAVVALTVVGDSASGGAARLLLIVAVAVLAGGAAARLSPLHAVAVAVAALGVAAAQMPLIADSLSSSGTPAVWTELAEGSRLAALALLALLMARRGSAPSFAFVVAALGAVGAAAVLAREPSSAAILSMWAVGATLSLPVALYIAAGGCSAFVLAASLPEPGARHLAVGVLLLTVAGIQPSFVHHNLTAVLALAVLAEPVLTARASTRGAPAASRLDAPSISSGSAVAAVE
jgi:hypothetical protein